MILSTSFQLSFGQETVSFHSTKPGSFAKAFKKTAESITAMEISGELNGKDFETLFLMSNLSYLDLSNVSVQEKSTLSYIENNSKIKKTILEINYNNVRTLHLLISSQLKVLKLPRGIDYLELHPGRFSALQLEHLYAPDCLTIPSYGGIDNLHFNNIHLFNTHGYFTKDYLKRYVEDGYYKKAGYYYDDHKYPEYRETIDTLFVESKEQLSSRTVRGINPSMLKIESTGELAIVSWRRKDSVVDLSNISYLYDYAFYENKSIKELIINNSMKNLPSGSFSRCDKLEKINIQGVDTIHENAFCWCNNLTDITLSGVREIKPGAFSCIDDDEKVKITLLDTHPFVLGEHNDVFSGIITIPKGCRLNYSIGNWKNFLYRIDGEKTDYSFLITTPGTLKDSITDEIRLAVTDLNISGVIYDTDFPVILECKLLKNLDLSRCLIVESPETAKESYENAKAIAAFFGMFFNQAANLVEGGLYTGSANLDDYAVTQVGKAYFDGLNEIYENIDSIPISTNCLFPKGIDQLRHLEELRLPLQLKTIQNLSSCKAWKIVLPNAPTSIAEYAFSGSSVKELIVPSSVITIGTGAFNYCNMDLLDLSKTEFKYFASPKKTTCKIFKAPQGCKNLRPDGYLSENEMMKVETAFFYTKDEPDGITFIGDTKVHIPKGCKPGWPRLIDRSNNKWGRKITIIDDL